ncbi:SusD/RagB family nutrient-binding outer membrane lipoprotein, partial [Bacteroides sp.]|uniref:SusD/RagB family nutrient-binding outer membrane lipoprotein n=1 Tax=Bacteroides sp. TaxID=29523 RepID=UPI00258B6FEA
YINSGKVPAKYELEKPINVSVPAPTLVTAKWEGSNEQKLEKIITQKWIALFPNGQEAWSEWRRTGYPKLHQVIRNNSGGEVSSEKGIRRMIYPKSERQSADQIENYNKAVELLGGPDKPSTNLWWDKK